MVPSPQSVCHVLTHHLTSSGSQLKDIPDVASEIDKFYEEASNVLIPIFAAREWVIAKMKGVTPDWLQEELARLRRVFNEPEDTPSKPEVKDRKKEQ